MSTEFLKTQSNSVRAAGSPALQRYLCGFQPGRIWPESLFSSSAPSGFGFKAGTEIESVRSGVKSAEMLWETFRGNAT